MTAGPQVFAAAVTWAAKFVTTKPTVPIHGALLMHAEAGSLTITAYNENVTARATVPFEGDGHGRTAVSGRLLGELAGTFPAKSPVRMAGAEQSLTITAGRWRGTLPVMREEDFPPLPESPARVGTVGGDALATAISRAAVAAAKDTNLPVMYRAMHLTFGDDLVAMATDGYRATRIVAPFSGAGAEVLTALVLTHPMAEVAAAFAGPDEIVVGLAEGVIGLSSSTRSVVLRQLAEKYDAELIGKFFTIAAGLPEHVRILAPDLIVPLKRAVMVQEKEGPISLILGDNEITLTASSSQLPQDSDEAVAAIYAGPECTLAFNPRYLSEALTSAPGDRVQITMTTERLTGVLLTVPGNDSWQHALMPIKKPARS